MTEEGLTNTSDATGELQPAETGTGDSDVSSVRDLILTAFTDLVPELIGGSTVGEVIASVDVARKAYAAITHQFKGTPSQPIAVPAGSPPRGQSASMADLSPSAKIQEGLRQRKARSNG